MSYREPLWERVAEHVVKAVFAFFLVTIGAMIVWLCVMMWLVMLGVAK